MGTMETISYIIPSIGRESLARTVASIEKQPGDEIIVVQHTPPSGNWGNDERNEGMEKAHGLWLAFIDDDDIYVPGHREVQARAITENPHRYPMLFRMRYPSGRVLWRNMELRNGNVGSPMILVPNIKEKLHLWDRERHFADYMFINQWAWPRKRIQWREEVIVLIGHNDERYEERIKDGRMKREPEWT